MKTIKVDGKKYRLKKYLGKLDADESICDNCAFIAEACSHIKESIGCLKSVRHYWTEVKPRRLFGRVAIGRLELEAGWYRGEDWAIEAQALRLHAGHSLQVLYIQVAKICLSVAIDIRPEGQRRKEE